MFKTNKIYIKKLYENTILPVKGTALSAGYDLHAYIRDRDIVMYSKDNNRAEVLANTGNIVLLKGDRALIPTGISLACHPDYCVKVYPRSSCVKRGFTQPNCVGVIDADYRGELHVLIHNISDRFLEIQHEERIAQMMLEKVEPIEFEIVTDLPTVDSTRGVGGIGSTGV